jgi:hypothetical protein
MRASESRFKELAFGLATAAVLTSTSGFAAPPTFAPPPPSYIGPDHISACLAALPGATPIKLIPAFSFRPAVAAVARSATVVLA